MPYIGHGVTNAGTFYVLDDLTMSSSTTYTLQVGGVSVTPKADNLLITLDGVVQHTPDAYTISGSTLTFASAPGSGVDFYGIIMGQSASIGQGSIGADELKVTGDGSANQVLSSDADGTMTWKDGTLSTTSATGDIIYRNASGVLAKLSIGSAGQLLTVASGLPSWATDSEPYLPLAGGTMSGAINLGSQNVTNGGTITGTFVGGLTGNVTGNVSGTALTVTQAAQSAITSVGTLTSLATSGNISLDNSGSLTRMTIENDTESNILFTLGGTSKGQLYADSNGISIRSESGVPLLLKTNGNTTALTIDTSQNATFAGNITIPEYVYHAGDTDTFVRFIDNGIVLGAGNTTPAEFYATGTGNTIRGNTTFAGNITGKTDANITYSAGNAITTPTGAGLHMEGSDIVTGRIFFQGYQADGGHLVGMNNETDQLVMYDYHDGSYIAKFDYDGNATFTGSVTGTALHAKKTTTTGLAGVEVGTGSGDLKLTTYGSGYSTNGGFRQDGAAVDADDNLSGGLSIISRHASSGEIRFYTDGYADGNKRLTIANNGQSTFTGDIISEGDIQMANGRGIDFSATADSSASKTSETFDDYEEGSWEPEWFGGTGNFSSITHNGDTGGRYTKIGRMVYLNGCVRTDSFSGGSGYLLMRGLPFTSAARSNGDDADFIGSTLATGNWVSNNFPQKLYLGQNTTEVQSWYLEDYAGNSSLNDTGDIQSGLYNRMHFTLVYVAA